MSLKGVAKETLRIIEAGGYLAPSGAYRDIRAAVSDAVRGTKLFTPEELRCLLPASPGPSKRPRVFVTAESTQEAAYRLCREGHQDPLVLNFASARNAGGGFLRGAKAQEEDLARCSALYPCLITQPRYYEANRAQDSLLYTDHIIYSPRVPWFRIRSRELLEEPYIASVVTAPAPNRGQILRRDPSAVDQVQETLRRRAGYILTIAKLETHRVLVLGAWGCGVFQNRPSEVAAAFEWWLGMEPFSASFDLVVFAVFSNRQSSDTLQAFRRCFD